MGRAVLVSTGIHSVVEPRVLATLPPWSSNTGIVIHSELVAGMERAAPDEVRRITAAEALEKLPQADITIWPDGSASNGVTSGGGGAVLFHEGLEEVIRVAAGAQTSSCRAELVAICAA